MCVQHVTVASKGMLVSEYKSALKHIPIMVSTYLILVRGAQSPDPQKVKDALVLISGSQAFYILKVKGQPWCDLINRKNSFLAII